MFCYFWVLIDILTIFMGSGMSFCGIWVKFQVKWKILDPFREKYVSQFRSL